MKIGVKNCKVSCSVDKKFYFPSVQIMTFTAFLSTFGDLKNRVSLNVFKYF